MSTLTIGALFTGLSIVLLVTENAALKNDVLSDALLLRHEIEAGSSTQCALPKALGMESHLIRDSAITASSSLDYNMDFYGPQLARLNNKHGMWVKHNDDAASWIQVNLGGRGVITGLQTQGGEGPDKAVKAFKVKTGTDLCGMDYIKQNGTIMVFTAANHTITTHDFFQVLSAQFIRIEPTVCGEYCALRFEVLGCLDVDRCPSNWEEFDSACYLLAHEARVTYFEAARRCANQNAVLARIDNQENQEFLAVLLRKDPMNHDGYYIGLNDRSTEGKYVWPDGTPLAYTNWESNDDNRDCVAMKPEDKGRWKSTSCSTLYPYICERQRKVVDTTPVLQSTAAICNKPKAFGLQTYKLPHLRITASSRWRKSKDYGWIYARLYTYYEWVADPSDNAPWIQVDLYGSTHIVSGVITQGASFRQEWITAFKVRVGTRQCDLRYISEDGNTPKVFTGIDFQRNTFPNPVEARFVRIEPINWHVACSLRMEIIGCCSAPKQC